MSPASAKAVVFLPLSWGRKWEKTLVDVDDLMIFDGCSVAAVFRPQLYQFEVRRCDVVAGEYPGSFSQ